MELKDTGVFMALFHHLDGDVHKNVIMETKKGCVFISVIAEQLRSKMRECLTLAHAVTGCDTVSATYGLVKLRAYKKLLESKSWKDIMHIVGDEDVDKKYKIKIGSKLYMELYGKLGKKAYLLDHLREIMYTLQKYIPVFRMPPTSRVFQSYTLRAHLEVNTCKILGQRLEEEDHGSERNIEFRKAKAAGSSPAASYVQR